MFYMKYRNRNVEIEMQEYRIRAKVIFLEIFKRNLNIFINIKQRRNRRTITTKYGKYKIAAV